MNKIINQIINKLYFDLYNYDELLETNNFEEFYDYISSLNKYRHHHYYKCDKDILSFQKYEIIKKEFKENNFELLDEYKMYENIINKSIEIFDEKFNYYLTKLEPELLKYFVTVYYNPNDYDYEKEKDDELIKMLRGLRKMCICLVRQQLKAEFLI